MDPIPKANKFSPTAAADRAVIAWWYLALRRPGVLAITLGPFIGVLVGLAVFSITQLHGGWQFTVGGALIGLIVASIFNLLWGRAERLTLSEVTIKVPDFAELRFSVSGEQRRVAWNMFVETITRVSTQPLGLEQGIIREALTSLYGLFSVTRDLLKAMPPSPATTGITVELFATRMLNHEIRPFLSKWHPRLKLYEQAETNGPDAAWQDAAACRVELDSLHIRLASYAKAYGELAGVKQLELFFS